MGNSIKRLPKLSQLTAPSAISVARLVLSSRLICATDDPRITGSISRTMRFTRGSRGFQRGRGSSRSASSDGSCDPSCSTPAANTA